MFFKDKEIERLTSLLSKKDMESSHVYVFSRIDF